jgi:phosphate transport system substrate-binding protein
MGSVERFSHLLTRSAKRKQDFRSIFSRSEKLQQFNIQHSAFSTAVKDRLRGRLAVWLRVALAVGMCFSLALLGGCGRPKTGVIIAGSTSVQPYAEVLVEGYAVLYHDDAIDVQGGGSSAGIAAAESGTADIGMSSRDLNEKEQELWFVEIAKDGLAVIINPNNPLTDLTITQIRDIYSTKISNWSELGGSPAKIHIIAREEGSGTRSAFESLVMGEAEISPKAIVQDSNGAVRQLVADDKNSIGFISLGLVDQTVKALTLDGIVPNRENVINGTYSLFRPFLFVAGKEPVGAVKQFIDFTLSPNGQKLLEHEGLISSAIEGIENEEI